MNSSQKSAGKKFVSQNACGSKYKTFNNASKVKINPKMNQSIHGSVKRYEEKWDQFYRRYLFWKNERLLTISKLEELMKEVHEDQLAFNQTNVMFKELNISSRKSKDGSDSKSDFFASLGTFLTDAASGITSIAQAVSVENYNKEFKQIMEHDAEISKPLYTARSLCLQQYKGVEEIVRHFHSETFGDTMENISKSLKVDELWMDLKNAQGENAVSVTLNSLDIFFSNAVNTRVLGKVYNSFEEYMNNNPATLDACKSAGKAIYDIYDTWGRDKEKAFSNEISFLTNQKLLRDEMAELNKLRSVADNDKTAQAKLESDIDEAIDYLRFELREISSLF
ncbi:uncharacterized protein NPIL_40411 [Nephila pilipes]|uniref:Uncharacterized protein n=1 Tax=Nephila pilipes TaxID=299642 RepID=A0A8X6UB81_NEPPI|nr:uncharacterized protein NPIL_40411 [Nephila pilipes]